MIVGEAVEDIAERLHLYRDEHSIDLELVMTDIIVLLKVMGRTREEFLQEVADIWDSVKILGH